MQEVADDDGGGGEGSAAVADPHVLNATEISILESLYESYTSSFGHMVGRSGGIDTNCTIVMQETGRAAVATPPPTYYPPPEDPPSSPVGPVDARGMRRRAAAAVEDAWFHPADDERELQVFLRPRLQIRFDLRYSTRLGRYDISDYNREFKIFIGNNLEAVGEDLNNLMGVERVVEVREVKLLAQQTSSPTATARGTTAPSLLPTRRPHKPIGNAIDDVEINSKSFMVGATAGVAVFFAVAVATVVYLRWRRRADDRGEEGAAGGLSREDRREDANAAAPPTASASGTGGGMEARRGDDPPSLGDDRGDGAAAAAASSIVRAQQPQQHLMSSQIQDSGEPRIGEEEEDERLRAFAGPKSILSTHHPERRQQQRQEVIGNNSGNGPPWVHSSSSLPDGPLDCEGSDVAVIVAGTTEAIDITDSINGKFYANLVSVPFQDDELDTGMPVDIRPHPIIMQMHLQQQEGGGGGGEEEEVEDRRPSFTSKCSSTMHLSVHLPPTTGATTTSVCPPPFATRRTANTTTTTTTDRTCWTV